MSITQGSDTAMSGGGGVSSWDTVLTWTPAVGSVLHVDVQGPTSTSNNVSSLSMTGVTWQQLATSTTNRKSYIYRGVVNSATGSLPTLTVNQSASAGAGNYVGSVSEVAGLPPAPTGGFVSAQNTTGTGTTVTTASVQPAAGRPCIIRVALVHGGTASGLSADFTQLPATTSQTVVAYKIVTNPNGTDTHSCSVTGSSSFAWMAHITLYQMGTLAFTQQPTALAPGGTFSPTVTVAARTDGTNTDTSAVGDVTLSVASGDGAISGTNPRTVSSGVATFTGLGMSSGTTSHTLDAAMPGYVTQPSSSFSVGAVADFRALAPARFRRTSHFTRR